MFRIRGLSSGGDSWWASLTESERADDNQQRSHRRALRTFERFIRSHDLRRLLTFTNGADGGWATTTHALRDVADYMRSEGAASLYGPTAYALRPERGAEGRVHVHAAVRHDRYIEYERMRVDYSSWMEKRGHHSASTWHRVHAGDEGGKHSGGFSSAKHCARYLCGYAFKTLNTDRIAGSWHHRCGRGSHPEPRRLVGFTLGEFPAAIRDTFSGSAALTPFFDPDGYLCGYWVDVG